MGWAQLFFLVCEYEIFKCKKNYNLKKNINRFYCNTELNNYIFKPQVRTCNFYMPKYLGELSFNTSYN